jgi:hypothetical protein
MFNKYNIPEELPSNIVKKIKKKYYYFFQEMTGRLREVKEIK